MDLMSEGGQSFALGGPLERSQSFTPYRSLLPEDVSRRFIFRGRENMWEVWMRDSGGHAQRLRQSGCRNKLY